METATKPEIKQVGFKTTTTAAMQFDDMFSRAQAQSPELTKGEFFAKFVDAAKGDGILTIQKSVDTENFIERKKFEELERTFEKFKADLLLLLSLDAEKSEADILAEVRATQQRAMIVPSSIETERSVADNEILFSIQEPQLAIFKETASRLSVKLKKEVTLRDLFIDVLLRYVVQMYNEWFFPFVIRPDEFEAICGYKHKDLLQWLNNKKAE